MNEYIEKLAKAWKRVFVPYSGNIYATYLEEALTGFVLFLPDPVVKKANQLPCVCVNLEDWIRVKELGATTVTPFRIVAKGTDLIAKGFMPHTGLLYAVRNVEGAAMLHIPVEDFKVV